MDIGGLTAAIPYLAAFTGFGIGVGITRASIKQHEKRITLLEDRTGLIITMAADITWIKKELKQLRSVQK